MHVSNNCKQSHGNYPSENEAEIADNQSRAANRSRAAGQLSTLYPEAESKQNSEYGKKRPLQS